jgi:hypothetical protein
MALEASAIIRVDSVGTELASRILNAGDGGMLLVLPQARPVGTRIHVTVRIAAPPSEIYVVGVIVHLTPEPGGSGAVRAGIALTTGSAEWAALCRRLAQLGNGDAGR